MMHWGNGMFGLGWAIFGGLMMLLFWAAVIVLAVLAIRALVRSSNRQSGSTAGPVTHTGPVDRSNDPAIAILKERYARGEITKDQYDQMRADLMV